MLTLIAWMSLVTASLDVPSTNNKGGEWFDSCTAVYVAPNEALTAAHCFEKQSKGKLAHIKAYDDGLVHPISVVMKDVLKDIALVHIDGPAHESYASLGPAVQRGDKIYLISSEASMPGTYAEGIVENVIIDKDLFNTPMIVHSASVKPGASGSGLFDARGHLIGINTISYGSLSEAVETLPIRHLLEDVAQAKILQR